jgi:alpha-tubulin suppressor-like RCC1 family protein
VVVISAGPVHVLALKSDGTVVAWGGNSSGQTNVPSGLNNVVAVAAGRLHSLALKNDGTVVAWGSGSATNMPSELTDVMAIAAGNYHSLALASNGTVVAWGLGLATNVPSDLSNVVAIAAGGNSSMALKNDSTVVAWGSGSATNVPAGLSNVVAIAPFFAIKNDGMLSTWSLSLTPPAGLSNVVAIAVGYDHCLAITIDLKISSIKQATPNPAIRFHTFSGQQYLVEYSPDLSPGSWSNLPGGDVSGNGFDALVTDTNAVAAAKFYRIKQE